MALTKVTYSMIQGAAANVLDFGAVGDGVADDSAAFTAAFAQSNTIFVPEGSFKISNVNTPENAYVFGVGGASEILCNSGVAFISDNDVADVQTFNGLKFTLSSSARGISVERASLATCCYPIIQNCQFECTDTSNCYGIRFEGTQGSLIQANKFWGVPGYVSQFDCIVILSGATTFNISPNITDNHFYDLQNAVYMANTVDDRFFASAGLKMINNTVLGLTEYGVYTNNCDWVQIEQNTFDYVGNPIFTRNTINAKIRNNYAASNKNEYGIYVEQNSTTTLYPVLEYTEIMNNRVFNYLKALGTGPGNDGIAIKATSHPINYVNISGNTIDNCISAINMNFAGTQVCNNGNISENKIRACDAGVYFGASTASNMVCENTMQDITAGNYFLGSFTNNAIGLNVLQGVRTIKTGTVRFNGNGVTTEFSVAHNMTSVPVTVTASLNAAGLGYMFSYVDATNVYFKFAVAPPVGVDNVIVSYQVSQFNF